MRNQKAKVDISNLKRKDSLLFANERLKRDLSKKQKSLIYYHFKQINEEFKLRNKIGTLYVVKHDPKGIFHKGDIHLPKYKQKHITYRNVSYLTDEELRKEFRKVNEVINTMIKWNDSTHGFINDRNTLSNAKAHLNARSAVNIDLENSFDQICRQEVLFIFYKIFDLNWELSNWLTNTMTVEGFMYQGHPLSPLFFNLITMKVNDELSRLVNNDKKKFNEYHAFTQYADDFTISLNLRNFPKRKLELIYKIIRENGWEINPNKTEMFRKNSNLGIIITGYRINHNGIHVVDHKKINRKTKYLLRKILRDIRYSEIKRPAQVKDLLLNSLKEKYEELEQKFTTPQGNTVFACIFGFLAWKTSVSYS